jgi:hypothetical protein
VQAVPSVLQICCVWLIPESPRWYVSKGKPERALAILTKVHAEGDHEDELVSLEYDEIRETIAIEKEAEQTGWLELFKTKGNRHRLLILVSAGLFSQWSGNGLVSYYINGVLTTIGITDPDMQLKINGVLNIWNALVAITMCFFVDKFGRRPLFLISTGGMCGSFVIWTILSERFNATHVKANGSAVVFMIFLYYTFYNLAWSGLLVGYTVEILPYSLRAKGMCYMFAMLDIALFFNTYVNPTALDKLGWKYYIVYVSPISLHTFCKCILTNITVRLARLRIRLCLRLLHRDQEHPARGNREALRRRRRSRRWCRCHREGSRPRGRAAREAGYRDHRGDHWHAQDLSAFHATHGFFPGKELWHGAGGVRLNNLFYESRISNIIPSFEVEV